jgi:glycosyltransferase involved in cell wall biosynthesis
MTYLSVVIPVYNESSLIDELVKRVKTNTQLITEDFEIIIVDDGSQDKTWNSIENEAKSEKRIKGIKFSRNFGHHYAITAGLHNSSGEWVVVMDGDLQDRPEVILDLYKKAQEGFDVVFVSRQNRPEKLYYRIAQKIFYWILRSLSGIDFDSRQANFSIINKKVVEAFRKFPENSRFYGSTIKWLGFKRSFILADHGHRYSGKPSYTLRKRIRLASDIIISFSERPLNTMIIIAFTTGFINTSIGFWITYEFMTNGNELNYVILLIVNIFIISITLLIFLGVIGIYISRIYKEVKNRPLYIIEYLNNFDRDKGN